MKKKFRKQQSVYSGRSHIICWQIGEMMMNADNTIKECKLQQVIQQIINEVSLNMCDNFCKYRDISNTDKDGVCDYVRTGNICPLDRLQ